MRILNILAILVATSSVLFLSSYSVAQVVTPTETKAVLTSDAIKALVAEIMAEDLTKTKDEAISEAVVSLINIQPDAASAITKMAFEAYPDSGQVVAVASVSTGLVSSTDIAAVTGIVVSAVSEATAAGDTGGDVAGDTGGDVAGDTGGDVAGGADAGGADAGGADAGGADAGVSAGTGGTNTTVVASASAPSPVGGGGGGGSGGGGLTVSGN